MKKDKTPNKLVLTRTTLRRLDEIDLEKAVGGISAYGLCHTLQAVCQPPQSDHSLALFWCGP